MGERARVWKRQPSTFGASSGRTRYRLQGSAPEQKKMALGMAGAALKGGQGHDKAELIRLVAQRRAVQRAYMHAGKRWRAAAQAFARIQARVVVCLCAVAVVSSLSSLFTCC
jgi:hypothetical protein